MGLLKQNFVDMIKNHNNIGNVMAEFDLYFVDRDKPTEEFFKANYMFWHLYEFEIRTFERKQLASKYNNVTFEILHSFSKRTVFFKFKTKLHIQTNEYTRKYVESNFNFTPMQLIAYNDFINKFNRNVKQYLSITDEKVKNGILLNSISNETRQMMYECYEKSFNSLHSLTRFGI